MPFHALEEVCDCAERVPGNLCANRIAGCNFSTTVRYRQLEYQGLVKVPMTWHPQMVLLLLVQEVAPVKLPLSICKPLHPACSSA